MSVLKNAPGRTVAVAAVCAALALVTFSWIGRRSTTSPEDVLAAADRLGWNNNWLGALPLYVRAEQMFRSKGDRGHALYAHVSQFAVKMENSDLSQLIAELRDDLVLPEASQPDVRLRVLEMKAKCEQEYDAGIAKETFAEVEKLAFRQHKLYLASRASGEQGILAFTLGDIAEATSRVRRAYGVAKYLGDPAAHVRYAEMIGMGIVNMGRPEQAMKFLDEAIATQKAHPEIARPTIAYNAKIDGLGQIGRYSEALALADQAVRFPREHQFYGQLQSLLESKAEVEVRAGKINEAVSGYQEALFYAKKVGSWRAITFIDSRLATAYERLGKLPEALCAVDDAIKANQQTPREMFLVPGNMAIKARIEAKMGHRAQAESLYVRGSDILDLMLAHVPTPEMERLLLTELEDLYSGYFELLSNDHRYSEAFRVIERAHGRIEAQELEFDHTEAPHSPTAEERQLQALEVALLRGGNSQTGQETLRRIRPDQGNPENRAGEEEASLGEIRQQLRPDELLVEYVLAARQSYALAVSSSRVTRYELPAKQVIEEEVRRYRDTLRHQKTDAHLGSELFTQLLGFTNDFGKAKSLIVVPDGGLHLLPFSALVESSGKYLVEDKAVSMTPSATVLSILRRRGPTLAGSRPYLGVAAWTEAVDSRPWVLRSVSSNAQPKELLPLPESRDEVESIAAMLPRPATVLLGHEATKATFESLPLSDYRVLHLALHGSVDPVFPDRSALVFAPSAEDNGRLEARDIRRLHLRANLVTLSACDTGVGPVGISGVESIVASFIQAGANSVVSTLWELEDHSSNRLMKAFYVHLGSADKADALRQAKLDLLHSGLSPYYWASYEIVGDPKGALFPTR